MSYEVGGGSGGGNNTIRPGTLVEVGLNRLCSRSCQHMRDDWIQQFIQAITFRYTFAFDGVEWLEFQLNFCQN